MSRYRKGIGRRGEAAALTFLQQQGYALLAANYQTPTSEIDLVVKDRETICFVEVKTRSGIAKGRPKEAVNAAKQQKIRQGAAFYLKAHGLDRVKLRFDVIEVMIHGGLPPDITHIKAAF